MEIKDVGAEYSDQQLGSKITKGLSFQYQTFVDQYHFHASHVASSVDSPAPRHRATRPSYVSACTSVYHGSNVRLPLSTNVKLNLRKGEPTRAFSLLVQKYNCMSKFKLKLERFTVSISSILNASVLPCRMPASSARTSPQAYFAVMCLS